MSFSPETIAIIRREYNNSVYGEKTTFFNGWAKKLDCHWATISNLVKEKKRSRKGSHRKPEYRTWARLIFQIKKRPPEGAGEISTENAIALAIKQGLIPPEATTVPIATFNSIGRKEGWTKTSIQCVRFQAEKPNDAHHFDASTSDCFYVAKEIKSNGIITDYLLKLWSHPSKSGYKNKPVPVDQLRAWRYGIVDDYSGRFIARYVAARGEAGKDSLEFICWAWEQLGLCKQLLCDQGSLKKHLPANDLMERLGVEFPQMMPYKSRGHGKIERPWSTLSGDFELLFFAANTDSNKFEIPLSELNKHLMNYLNDKYNQLPHRFERKITRQQAWAKVALDGGLVRIPENTLLTIAKNDTRKISIEGIVRLNNVAYEVIGLYDAEIKIFWSIFGDQKRLVAMDIKTGNKYEMRDYKPLTLGEFRSFKETPHEQIIKESQTLTLTGTTLYADKKPQDEKIISIPIRTKENRELEDPFDVDSFASLQEAMRGFCEIVGVFIPPDQREVIESEIEAHGLSKAFVENLALEVRAQLSKRAAM